MEGDSCSLVHEIRKINPINKRKTYVMDLNSKAEDLEGDEGG